MHLQDITNLLNLQGVTVTKFIYGYEDAIYITIEPVEHIQTCPCCKGSNIIRRGSSGDRKIRHLPILQHKTILKAPKIKMSCKDCNASFTWQYAFVMGKSRYTNDYKEFIAKKVSGATVLHCSETCDTPYSTVERIYKKYIDKIVPEIQEKVISESHNTNKLVLGIDDFAIRKGHTYNTGVHDLRNGTLLEIISGRKLEDLRKHKELNPKLFELKPYAVVIDLAPYYHTFVQEVYPEAIRIADRFHVNGYALEALNGVRKRISQDLAPTAKTLLKRNKSILEKRNEYLTVAEKSILKQLLAFSPQLKSVYEWKEELIEWYDCCTNVIQAKNSFYKWCKKGHLLNIQEVEVALITFENWSEEIINYHYCRYTNAAVEGRNNKIKALQRRHYFTRNKNYYR
jgi:transposase